MRRPNPAAAFKPYIVKRPNGGCQVLFPLSELDAIIARVLEAGDDRLRDAINLEVKGG